MKTKQYGRRQSWIDSEAQLERELDVGGADRARQQSHFGGLEQRLVRDQSWEREEIPLRDIQQAATDASALAWTTPYPLLVMPGLFEEIVKSAYSRRKRQERIRQRTHRLWEPSGIPK